MSSPLGKPARTSWQEGRQALQEVSPSVPSRNTQPAEPPVLPAHVVAWHGEDTLQPPGHGGGWLQILSWHAGGERTNWKEALHSQREVVVGLLENGLNE